MTTTHTARRLYNGVGSIEFPVITVDDGRITEIYSDPTALASATDVLAPSFFDIHTHGAIGYDVMSANSAELGRMEGFLAAHGTAAYLPTTVTAALDTILRSLEALADHIERAGSDIAAPGARPVGIHLEGPFLSHAKRGVHSTQWLLEPTRSLLDRMQQAARGHIRLFTVAPELDGAMDAIAYARELGIRSSLGHSDADAATALAALDAGAQSATHTFNAMRRLDHREPGLLGVALTDERIFSELICDGVHVHPAVVCLWWRAVGAARGILVTDAMAAAGMPDGSYRLAGLDVTVRYGRAVLSDELAQGTEVLAGSLLTMDDAVRNFIHFTGAGPGDAVALASLNPARLLDESARVAIRPGGAATFVRLDAQGKRRESWIGGQRC